MRPEADTFRSLAEIALDDHNLRRRVRTGTQNLANYRADSITNPADWERLRDYGHAVRMQALAKLPELLERLEAKCSENGMRVYWAANGEDANRLVLQILKQRNVRLCVKGKSMVSEEICLRECLQDNGIDTCETDLGEYIIQLEGEKPSHIIAPAIHKSKEQVARLFHHKLGMPYAEEPELLTAEARRVLREKFRLAGAGITGVNMAIAETGTLCLAENEGNIRMSTTIPPVHIAIMGIEKVIEKLQDLPAVASLLTRSCTGQSMSTYFSMISSPRSESSQDGPMEIHLILLDNGRTRIYSDPGLRQTLLCLRCGACLNHCPVYTRVGGHAYGEVYTGPIGSILSPQLFGMVKAGELVEASTLCGACAEICPVKIPIPDILLRLRQNRNQSKKHSAESLIWRIWQWANASPVLYGACAKCMAAASALGITRWAPGLRHWARYRKLPRFPRQSLHERVKELGVSDE